MDSSSSSSLTAVPRPSGQQQQQQQRQQQRHLHSEASPPSDAKRRMEHMATGMDRRIMGGVILLTVTFVIFTITAVSRIPGTHDGMDQLFFETMRNSRTIATTGIKSPEVSGHNRDLVLTNRLPSKYDSYTEIDSIDELQHVFPIHVHGDTEEIDHPGALLATGHTSNPFSAPSKMTVPKFWTPTLAYKKDVRDFLGEHGKRLMKPREAEQIGSFVQHPLAVSNGNSGNNNDNDNDNNNHRMPEDLETIYVSIASYRDYECRATLIDVLERAKYPERIRVAVIDQRVDGDMVCAEPDLPCSQNPEQTLCKYHPLIDVFHVEAKLSVGPVFARHLAHRMYRGEYFAMQVDSHVRFTKDWDEDIIGQWKSAENEMAVLTTYLSDLIGSINPITHENQHPGRPIMCQTGYEGNGKMRHLRHGQQPEGEPRIHGQPTLHPFWAAGFSFARGHFVVQVPYDQYLPMVFQGEEISIGLRGFTYGYDYYTAERSVAFHMYALGENLAKRRRVKLFWENRSLYPNSGLEGMKRLNGIIGMDNDPNDKYYDKEKDRYGLGQVRDKDKFFRMYGIHPESKTVEGHLCRFVGMPMQRKFRPLVRMNRMGIDFSKTDFEFVDPQPDKKK
mmetsp:Transcript_21374/g.61056  ORF Transcript_21374/g.61056 Transcript_21374/m.61056 type:complete len:617 (-) Transcript_21374:46-1896(-)